MRRDRFARGRGVFNCCCCGRRTRTVDQSADSECCPQCWDLAGLDNLVNDGGAPLSDVLKERDRLQAEAVKKGGDAAKIRASNPYLWPEYRRLTGVEPQYEP